jgi:hypothetical protein
MSDRSLEKREGFYSSVVRDIIDNGFSKEKIKFMTINMR